MKIEIIFTNETARRTEYFLRRAFKSKASLQKLAKVAILKVAADAAQEELAELEKVKITGRKNKMASRIE